MSHHALVLKLTHRYKKVTIMFFQCDNMFSIICPCHENAYICLNEFIYLYLLIYLLPSADGTDEAAVASLTAAMANEWLHS